MSEVLDRPLSKEEQNAHNRVRLIDCDVHPSLRSRADLNEFLPKRWQEHLKTYGDHLRTPYIGTTPYPRSAPCPAPISLSCRSSISIPTTSSSASCRCSTSSSSRSRISSSAPRSSAP